MYLFLKQESKHQFILYHLLLHHLSNFSGRFRSCGAPRVPSVSAWSTNGKSFSGFGGLTSSTGGSDRIFLPAWPVFRCQRPDRGPMPIQRDRFGDPMGSALSGWIETLPTTHWQRWNRRDSFLVLQLVSHIWRGVQYTKQLAFKVTPSRLLLTLFLWQS